jgi:phytoene desaturase
MQNLEQLNIGIIGAGIAGLATAVRLAASGHRVTVFEANDYPGGKLSSFALNGYRFDAGPSLFTMPGYVEELFEAAGEDMGDHFQYRSMPVACHYFWDDGTALLAHADPNRFGAEVERQLGVKASLIPDFLRKSRRKYELAGHIFLEKSLHRAQTWLTPQVLKAALWLPYFDIFTTMHRVHARWFKHPKLVQLFDRYATYNGSDPYKASGMLTIIPHFEYNVGVYYPEGGMHRITQSLYELSQRLGVMHHFKQPVERILYKDSHVTGLMSGGKEHLFDAVVSNMDVFYTYKKLLPDRKHPERILQQPKSTSALIFYWGVRRVFPELGLHNIFFSDNYQTEFEAHTRGEVTDDPTVYINITSKCTPTDAPEGCENWFVMVNVPPDLGQDWERLIPRIRSRVLQKLSARLGVDVAPLIDAEQVLDPRMIELKTSSHLGALYGYSSNTQMAAFMRHANFSNDLQGLYFVGGSVHPGGGIPLCLLSAKITAALIEEKEV